VGPVEIKVPNGSRIVFNNLYDSNNPKLLTADLLGVVLPGGFFIDVSWYPEGDSDGEYTVTVYRDSWDNIQREVETRILGVVVAEVEGIAEEYCQPVKSVSNAVMETAMSLVYYQYQFVY
jgi:hypothetical protein